MDFQFELGNTLDGTLRRFSKDNLSPATLMNEGMDYVVAQETFFALYNRGYIGNIQRKTYDKAEEINLEDRFRITVEGRDYIELHRAWWCRFWFRSIVCPVIVSFITALNAERVWHFMCDTMQRLLSP